ncbi:MAG: GlsB/YeaQ/YmgE family stress response membrane protein [bacterium]|nr:GlsB/YeaQ/YmgE family stress response membrane protein [bacterium]
MNFILWIVFGGLAGWIATMLTSTEPAYGILGNIVIGIIGAFLGGFIADKVNFKEGSPGADRPTDIWSFVWAVLGAVVLLFIVGLIF